MSLTPTQKQALSGLLTGTISAVCVSIEQALANPPITLHSLLVAAGIGAAMGVAHYLPALGTADKVEQQANAKAADKLSVILDRNEP